MTRKKKRLNARELAQLEEARAEIAERKRKGPGKSKLNARERALVDAAVARFRADPTSWCT